MIPSARVATRDKAVDLANHAGARFLHAIERFLLRSSLVPTTPFLPADTFDWVGGLEARWIDIRDELDAVLGYREDLPNFQDISVDQASITDDDGWKTFFFFGYGFRSEANCARCPMTASLLGQIPGLTTAFFSILSPRKEIGAHRGPWRGVLRYHLALKVPEPAGAAGISVGGEENSWQEGSSLLFDDGYEHRAWNRTDGIRVVLFVDVVRPLRPPADQINRALIWAIGRSPYVRDARDRHQAWEERFDAVAGSRPN
jgi:beta-hydroxylase